MTTITLNPSASNHDASQDGTGAVTLTGYQGDGGYALARAASAGGNGSGRGDD
jgi:hypothetical protein